MRTCCCSFGPMFALITFALSSSAWVRPRCLPPRRSVEDSNIGMALKRRTMEPRPVELAEQPPKSHQRPVDELVEPHALIQVKVRFPRPVTRIERPPRLPLWPAWNGIVLMLLSQLGLRAFAASLEDRFGGRVAPMMLDDADPFILIVHHRHSFLRFDPMRAFFRLLMPEGFPAHPHRGFETVTYVLPGRTGLVHRDSEGVKMAYGDGQAQWMTAGRGMLHEEIWESDLTSGSASPLEGGNLVADAELFQVWVNLPPEAKLVKPRIQLVTPSDSRHPVVVSMGDSKCKQESPAAWSVVPLPVAMPSGVAGCRGVTVRVLASSSLDSGSCGLPESATRTHSPVSILHATIDPNGRWALPMPDSHTCLVYVRRGSIAIGDGLESTRVSTHELAHFTRGKLHDGLVIANANTGPAGDSADVMVFAGAPLGFPVASQGTMVMNTQAEIEKAYEDYARGDFGAEWGHQLSDKAWREAVNK